MINELYNERRVFTGAESLLGAAVRAGLRVCFANPGTTEMPLVAALDGVRGIRAVLGLHENVCTGAADGYARMTRRAALTLVHLGPGLANGLSNLHNARRAHSPVLNVVGDHASWHLPADPPLASDIAALAGAVGACHQVRDRTAIASTTRDAIRDAIERRGVSTLVVPADFLLESAQDCPGAELGGQITLCSVGGDRIEAAARELRAAGPSGVLLLGGAGLTRQGQRAAGKISAATGAALYSETFPARAERGGGLPAIDRLPYFPEAAIDKLRDASAVILAGAAEPVAYFGYPGTPSRLAPDRTVYRLAGPGDDAEQALSALADVLGGPGAPRPKAQANSTQRPGRPAETFPAAAALTGESAGSALASWLPENAIVSVEGGTCGYPFYTASAGAPPHTVLTNTGGAIGQGLPAALGAAIAAPDRPVFALQSDGSALYTAQALWTMARESANVTVLIAANHAYGVLRTELRRQASTELGTQAARLTSLGDPPIDWDSLARGLGVTATTATTVGELHRAVTDALDARGPHLIQMVLR